MQHCYSHANDEQFLISMLITQQHCLQAKPACHNARLRVQLWQWCGFLAGLAGIYVASSMAAHLLVLQLDSKYLSPRMIYWLYRLRVPPSEICIAGLQAKKLQWA